MELLVPLTPPPLLLQRSEIFLTATDTNVGKTTISCLIASLWRAQGRDVAAIKPWASGGKLLPGGALQCDDARLLWEASTTNGRALMQAVTGLQPNAALIGGSEPIAPWTSMERDHINGLREVPSALMRLKIAARREGIALIVEGIGGLLVPLAEDYLLADAMQELALPTVLVTRTQLGTINHTLLTMEAMNRRDLEIAAVCFSRPEKGPLALAEEAGLRELNQLIPQSIPRWLQQGSSL